MISFYWPWLLLLAPLPLLVRRWLPPLKQQPGAALSVPFIDDFNIAPATSYAPVFNRYRLWLAALGWCLLVLAVMRPQWLGEPLEIPLSGRDLMLAVDLSGSMKEQDFLLEGRRVDRLTATKQVAGDFIERRQGDRLGLILFGEQAYLQTPLTFDRKTVHTLLNESLIGLAGKATAIGDAIGLAVKRLKDQATDSRVLILLTDGANTAGQVDPLKAARLAAHENVRIYTIGIGADRMEVNSLFGRRTVNPSRDLDETMLKGIAGETGGKYFRARDLAELNEIYQLLDQLEPIQQEAKTFRPVRPLYVWPLSLALMLAVLVILLPRREQVNG